MIKKYQMNTTVKHTQTYPANIINPNDYLYRY